MKPNSLGQKIKNFRKRAGMSQLELEAAIGASSGSISRLEAGKVNPSKETILTISNKLKLTDVQISSLFSVPVSTPVKILNIVSNLSQINDPDKLMQTAVDEISKQMDYITTCIFLLDGNTIKAKYVSRNKTTTLSMKTGNIKFPELSLSYDKEKKNYLLNSALENKVYYSNNLYDFGRGVVGKTMLRVMQKIIGMKMGIAAPLSIGTNKSIGSMLFIRKNEEDSLYELETLKALARQIAIFIVNSSKSKTKSTNQVGLAIYTAKNNETK